jgi:hypothetical protein
MGAAAGGGVAVAVATPKTMVEQDVAALPTGRAALFLQPAVKEER